MLEIIWLLKIKTDFNSKSGFSNFSNTQQKQKNPALAGLEWHLCKMSVWSVQKFWYDEVIIIQTQAHEVMDYLLRKKWI